MRKSIVHQDQLVHLNELFSITKVARSLNNLVTQIKDKALEKVIILKNNEPEAVLVNIDDYLVLKEKERLLEMLEISTIINQRGKEAHENTMSMDEMFQKAREARMKA
ncbi:MAG: type II toxin-antitoxin system Phd/YefM family antitoxin [Erysipelotrichia bacterium]|nr:type II toxin-antitoxin system Phd/YefM family antitoxin [Erysipelotrichia bacterium]